MALPISTPALPTGVRRSQIDIRGLHHPGWSLGDAEAGDRLVREEPVADGSPVTKKLVDEDQAEDDVSREAAPLRFGRGASRW